MSHTRRRLLLLSVVGAALVGFGAYGLATRSGPTVAYLATVLVLLVLMAGADRRVGFSDAVAFGLAAWAVAHLAGGIVALDGGRVLYNAVLLPHLRYDNVVHFTGFGVAGVAVWEAFSRGLGDLERPSPRAAGLAVWLFGMGVGAVNEVVEFAVSQNVAGSNVGGYLNTGRDLVANLLGAALAGALVARRERGRRRPPGGPGLGAPG